MYASTIIKLAAFQINIHLLLRHYSSISHAVTFMFSIHPPFTFLPYVLMVLFILSLFRYLGSIFVAPYYFFEPPREKQGYSSFNVSYVPDVFWLTIDLGIHVSFRWDAIRANASMTVSNDKLLGPGFSNWPTSLHSSGPQRYSLLCPVLPRRQTNCNSFR